MNIQALSCLVLCLAGPSQADFEIVKNTTTGKILGTVRTITQIEEYLGVPYASPPVGELRWRAPIPYPSWRDSGEVWNATYPRSLCPQYREATRRVLGEEDCLFLNIYVPRTPMFELYPVMVFIHPGSFQESDGNSYDGSLLARQGDVIVVTFNYRLGALGFLNTGDNQATGNYGLLDQKAVLEWVQDNIYNFQGDPDRVTIFGSGAGGVSTMLHALSPQNHGDRKLFHRVIGQSGSPFCRWGFQTSPRYYAMQLIDNVGCPSYSTALGLECLRLADVDDIVRMQRERPEGVDWPFVATVDGSYIPDIPDVMVSDQTLISELSQRYEYLLGVTDFETAQDYDLIKDIQNQDGFLNYVGTLLSEHFEDSEKMAEAVLFNYIDQATQPTSGYSALDWQYLSFDVSRDFQYLAPTINMTHVASSNTFLNSTAYYYLFAHKPSQRMVDARLAYPSADIVYGASHNDDLAYVLGQPLSLPGVTNADRQISIEMMTYWTNFAKTGNPTNDNTGVEWPEYKWPSQSYMQFGDGNTTENTTAFVQDHLQSNQVAFWNRELRLYGEGNGYDDSISIPVTNETVSTPDQPYEPIVTTQKGLVRGVRIVEKDYILDRFLRIPFAKPPLGFLRFKRPEPHTGWEGVFDATGNRSLTEWLNGCPVFNFVRNGSYGTEDCLFLNIYVPGGIDAARDQQLPVMVWFHGGAFVWGRGTGLRFYYDMERISNQGKVIGVTINYRLGPLGFLSTLDDNAPGNAGLLDQVEALKWIKENIFAFGGDPNRVTIFGESAGAGSVTMHMVSPLSQDLFLRGIAESGSIPAAWSISYEPLQPARRLAQSLDCPIDSNKLLVKCLQNKPVDAITKAGLYNDWKEPKSNAWAAVVDGYFLTDDPIKLGAVSTDKDLLLGHNSMDGFLFALPDFLLIAIDAAPMSREDIMTASTLFAPNVPGHVSDAVAFKYIDWKESDTGLVWPKIAIVNMYTDHMFLVPTYWNANERVAANGTGRTFMYRFSERARFGVFPEWKEADHTTEMVYTFGHPFDGRNFDDDDRKLSLAMMTHWTNFAWSGDPNFPNQGDVFAEWPEYTLANKYAMEFNTSVASDSVTYPALLSNYKGEIVVYWEDHVRDLWNLPLGLCSNATRTMYSNRKWINYESEKHSRATNCPEEPLVRSTEVGCVRGYDLESNGVIIERYLGLPYAKPPIGELRFTQPSAPEPWDDIYSATNFSKICPQGSVLDEVTMSEDCLYLNIYAPRMNATNEAGLPVMVWLHGGGFINGNGMEKLQGDTLAALGGVIAINFNYRLGSFGFMTTDDEYSPGNYGLLDQQFALIWIKSNIGNFGGNPDDITIFGNSAGGQSVLLQSLSPTNRDLGITKGIVESASIIPHDDLKQLDRAISLAEAAGCDTGNGNENLVTCLRNLDAGSLLAAQDQTGLRFEPTVDGQFLPNHPRKLAEETEVQKWTFIIGANDGDGSVRWGDVQTVADEERFHEVVDIWFDAPYGWRKAIPDQHYADYNDLNFFNNETKMQFHLTQMFGDERYIAPGLEVAEDYTSFGADVYFYLFTYPHDRPDFYGFPSWAGAAHSAEFSFVWGDVINDDAQSDDVKDLSRRIIEYWSNFAKTGNPNTGYPDELSPEVEWSTYKGRALVGLGDKWYIQLDLGDKTEMKKDLRPTEKALWLEYMVSQADYCEVDYSTPAPTSPPVEDLDNPVVETTTGTVVGERVQYTMDMAIDVPQVDVQAFLGVPYAMPPTGELRFANAQSMTAWTEAWDATIPKPPCMQWSVSGRIIGSEDCLYMDIHVPTGMLSSASMPIIFWIHGDFDGHDTSRLGGSFWSGGGSFGWDQDIRTINPSYLADVGGVVVVTPSFRLGPFGFLTTETENMRGNYGLSDLQQALIWIHSNARQFGADPSKITVMGHGSGAASAELLGALPSTKDYVARVISMSGSSHAPWAFCANSECMKIMETVVAQSESCSTLMSHAEMKECLQGLEPEQILSATPFKPIAPNSGDISNAWGTWRFAVDGVIIPKDRTLEDMLASSGADLVTGVTSHEFYNYLKTAYPNVTGETALLRKSIDDTGRFLAYSNVENWPGEVYVTLTHEYTNWDDRNDQELALQSATRYYDDLMFAVHSSKSIASKTMGSGSLYQYVINRYLQRQGENQVGSWTGGLHGDDVIYTFGLPFLNSTDYSDEDREFSWSVMSYWINFAWHGDPNNDISMQTWREYTGSNSFYLAMDTGTGVPVAQKDFNLEKNRLWSDVVPEFSPGTEVIINSTTPPTTKSTTDPSDCVSEIPAIGTGLGLNLTPEEADTAIYVMFSVCIVLGSGLTLIFLHWCCSSRMIKAKNREIAKQNHYTKNGTISSLEAYHNVSYEGEKPRSGEISAL